MKKTIVLFMLTLAVLQTVFADSTVSNYAFVERDSILTMDVYTPTNVKAATPCLIYVFGGGFMMGSKTEESNVDFCKLMADSGYVVAAIDYRLGMKGVTNVGVTNVKPLRNAIHMAVEDLYAATKYLLDNAAKLHIDKDKIIISGSSAGAITVLQADYELANENEVAAILPSDFRYAGVISMAGAILSYEGKPDYKKHAPAPTLFFHGTADKLVTYNKIQAFNMGFFGSNQLVKRFEKFDYPYYIIRYTDFGHDINSLPRTHNVLEINQFIREYVLQGTFLQKDMTIKKDTRIKQSELGKWKPKDLYKKK